MPKRQYTEQPFVKALAELMRGQMNPDPLGRYVLRPLATAVREDTGLSEEYVRLLLLGRRPLRTDVIEAVAKFFGLDPHYFVEYRVEWVKQQMQKHPELALRVHEFTRELVEALDQKVEET
jgi:hypothetical protein